MLLNSRPIRHLVTRIARAYGFLDPVAVLARLRGFAKPSEVAEPIELLRAGMLFHARGLVNTKAIQHNLDWVWPYWVERQFNPADPSFIPRAFSFSHINLTHRNWTAVGRPDVPYYPVVDPRGLVTPLFDGWSLDCWVVPAEGPPLFPSKLDLFDQELLFDGVMRVRSCARRDNLSLESEVSLCLAASRPVCCLRATLTAPPGARIAVALRPYNPEGVSFIDKVEPRAGGPGWLVNGRHPVTFNRAPVATLFSNYEQGDVSLRLHETGAEPGIACNVSMVTAVALFDADENGTVEVRAPIYDELDPKHRPALAAPESWADAMRPLARLTVSDSRMQRLYDLALANVVLHTPGEVYPGPYTYKRFWFRDAVFILNALLTLGGIARTRRALEEFAPRQRRDGYFLSQEGEWDSNGQVLWFYERFAQLSGEALPRPWLDAAARGARWITRKRLPTGTGRKEAGLLPAGFSAEHLGPNDFYYWDDFWSVGGLQACGELLKTHDPQLAAQCLSESKAFMTDILRSLPAGPQRRFPGALPASPHRRMDSGAIGSIVADYPLQLFPPDHAGMARTTEFLLGHCLHEGGFFQDMIHSGINAYLTLHLAQVRLRAGDATTAWALMDRVAELASPTGQWPEAIHPRTGGGCMGDGQHIWAAAEWLMMVRNLFVREEGGRLLLGTGVRTRWLQAGEAQFGPTLTPSGEVRVRFTTGVGGVHASIEAGWRTEPPNLEWRVPGCRPLLVPGPASGSGDHFLPFDL